MVLELAGQITVTLHNYGPGQFLWIWAFVIGPVQYLAEIYNHKIGLPTLILRPIRVAWWKYDNINLGLGHETMLYTSCKIFLVSCHDTQNPTYCPNEIARYTISGIFFFHFCPIACRCRRIIKDYNKAKKFAGKLCIIFSIFPAALFFYLCFYLVVNYIYVVRFRGMTMSYHQ